MCDFFWQSRTEEKSGEGDLTDILLAGGLNLDNPSHTGHHEVSTPDWPCQHLSSNEPSTLQSLSLPSTDFGDPFMNIYDPLSDERSSLDFIDSNNCTANRANDLFSRMLHVSPPVMGTAEGIAGFGIASQRNLGLKRRKTQAKKVVCIPAPASTNARQGGGEVVPSDLWAWRKYGQKPIKGSPYPRGYYRCSSSKGCSARKQVERSRTDPNMLVITYTSEHNHPWPTQRNALAGSTRSQFSKHNNYSNPKSSFQQNNRSRQKITEETNETKTSHTDSNISTRVKEEVIGEISKAFELPRHDDLHKIMQQSRLDDARTVPNSNFNSNDEFFEDLGEFFPLGKIMESIISDNNKGSNNRDIDPFKLLDWEP